MSGIEITHAQAKSLVELSEGQRTLAVRQLAPAENAESDDLCATRHGTSSGYRIGADGAVSEIGETLPAPD